VLVSGEGLRRGAAEVLATLLHEAAHGLADARSIKDTSRQGRWHNQRFAAIAGELGLAVAKDSKTGWSQTSLTDKLADRYRDQLTGLDAALQLWRHTERQVSPTTASRNLLACSCACGRKLRVARGTLEQAPIICGSCEETFQPERALTLSRQPATPPDPPRSSTRQGDEPDALLERRQPPALPSEQTIEVQRPSVIAPGRAREGGHER